MKRNLAVSDATRSSQTNLTKRDLIVRISNETGMVQRDVTNTLAIELNLANNQPVALNVSSYLNSPSDAVTLNITMSSLNNGATYAGQTVLYAKAKDMTVTVTNSGYRKIK